jgi:hypothetical protein
MLLRDARDRGVENKQIRVPKTEGRTLRHYRYLTVPKEDRKNRTWGASGCGHRATVLET